MDWEKVEVKEFGALFDGEYIVFEDMNEEQLLCVFEVQYRDEFAYDRDYFSDDYFNNDCWEEFFQARYRRGK